MPASSDKSPQHDIEQYIRSRLETAENLVKVTSSEIEKLEKTLAERITNLKAWQEYGAKHGVG